MERKGIGGMRGPIGPSGTDLSTRGIEQSVLEGVTNALRLATEREEEMQTNG